MLRPALDQLMRAREIVRRHGERTQRRHRDHLDVVGDQFDITNKLLRDQEATSSRSMHHSDGARVQVDIAASQISMDGHVRTLLICRDVTERLMLEHELLDVASRERAHLAHDVHDGLGQQLTGIALFLRGLGSQIVRELPAHAEDFERVNALVSKSIKDTRRPASGMSPIAVEHAGLAGALSTLSVQAKELCGLQVVLEIVPLFHTPIENRVASQLYRIVQKAVSNVARHAHATVLTITAQCADSELILTIADDGIGLAESPPARDPVTGMGLRIMRYRAEHIGGTVRIDRCSPRGTAIRGVLSSQRRISLVTSHQTIQSFTPTDRHYGRFTGESSQRSKVGLVVSETLGTRAV